MIITLPWPPSGLSPNARLHWAALAKLKNSYRSACAWQAKSQGVKQIKVERLHVFKNAMFRQKIEWKVLSGLGNEKIYKAASWALNEHGGKDPS